MKKVYYLFLFLAISLAVYALYIPAKAIIANYLIKQAWSDSQANHKKTKPWSWADMTPIYRIYTPKHDIDFVVMFGESGNILAFTPGLNPLSRDDNTKIISAHNDTHFRFLRDVKIADKFTLEDVNYHKKSYQVADKYIIDTRKNSLIIEENDEIKLITCYPLNEINSPYRLVVKLGLM